MAEDLKRAAGEAALAHVRDGMTVGLGTGSTAAFAIRALGARVREEGWNLRGVATSLATEALARHEGVPLTNLEDVDRLDVAIDGADEIDPNLDLIKGAGGALFREKVVARAADRVVIVADDSKVVPQLGTKAALPVEVHPFGWKQAKAAIEGLWGRAELRKVGEAPVVTDNGNVILDCRFGPVAKPLKLERELNNIPGVVENGLFVGLAHVAIVASATGVETLTARRV